MARVSSERLNYRSFSLEWEAPTGEWRHVGGTLWKRADLLADLLEDDEDLCESERRGGTNHLVFEREIVGQLADEFFADQPQGTVVEENIYAGYWALIDMDECKLAVEQIAAGLERIGAAIEEGSIHTDRVPRIRNRSGNPDYYDPALDKGRFTLEPEGNVIPPDPKGKKKEKSRRRWRRL